MRAWRSVHEGPAIVELTVLEDPTQLRGLVSATSQSRSCSSDLVVAANVLVSCRRPPRTPGTRTHAFRSAFPMSTPAHRSTSSSTPTCGCPKLGHAMRPARIRGGGRRDGHTARRAWVGSGVGREAAAAVLLGRGHGAAGAR
jgi:hypothetical protein